MISCSLKNTERHPTYWRKYFYQWADPRTVWKCIHVTNYTGRRETQACWNNNKVHTLCKPHVDSVDKTKIYGGGTDGADNSQHGTDARTTEQTWQKQRIYKNSNTIDEALKQHITNAVDDTYVADLRHKYTGSLGVTTRYLLDNLLDWYVNISPLDIKKNDTRYNDPVDTA